MDKFYKPIVEPRDKKPGGLLGVAYRKFVPAHIRTYGESLAKALTGRLDKPITEKDFSQQELAALEDLVNDSFGRQEWAFSDPKMLDMLIKHAVSPEDAAKYQRYKNNPPKTYQFHYGDYGLEEDIMDEFVKTPDWGWYNTLGAFGMRPTKDGMIEVFDEYNFDREPEFETSLGAKYNAPMGALERFANVVYDTALAPEEKRNPSAAGLAYLRDKGPKVSIMLRRRGAK